MRHPGREPVSGLMHVSKWPRSRIILEPKQCLQGLPWEPRAAVQDTTWNYHPFLLMNKRKPKSSVEAWPLQQTGVKPLLCKLLFRLCKSDFVLGKGGPRPGTPHLVWCTGHVLCTSHRFLSAAPLYGLTMNLTRRSRAWGLLRSRARLPCTAGFASTVSGWAVATNRSHGERVLRLQVTRVEPQLPGPRVALAPRRVCFLSLLISRHPAISMELRVARHHLGGLSHM